MSDVAGGGGCAVEGFLGALVGGSRGVAGACGEEELGGFQACEGGCNSEALVEEEAERGTKWARGSDGRDCRRWGWRSSEDEGGEFWMFGRRALWPGRLRGRTPYGTMVWGSMWRVLMKVVEGGGGVLLHADLGWVRRGVGGAEAAVVEGEDVDRELMELGEGGEIVGETAGAARED